MQFVGRNPPLIFLVILPASSITLMYIGLLIYLSLPTEGSFIGYLSSSIFIIELLYYGLTRPHYIKKYLKQGLEPPVIEFEIIKKIIPIVLSLSLSLTLIVLYLSLSPSLINFPPLVFAFLSSGLLFVRICCLAVY